MKYLFFLLILMLGLRAEVDLNNPFITFKFEKNIFKNIGQFTNKPLIICKDLSGSFEYISESELKLYPNEKLQASKIYKCSTNSAFFDFNKSFEIKTEEFGVKSLNRIDNSIKIEFNDIVNFEDLKKNLKLFNIDTFSKVDFELKPNVNSKVFEASIINYKNLKSLKIHIEKSLTSIYQKPLSNSFEKSLVRKVDNEIGEKLSKLQELLIYSVVPISTEGKINLQIRYYSSSGTNFANKNIEDFIEIFPKVDFKIQRDGYSFSKKLNRYTDTATLNGDFLPNRQYSIKFKKGLSTLYNILKEDKSFEVKTGNIEPFVKFVDEKSRISTEGLLKLKSINLNELKVVIDRLLDDNYRYFVNFSKANRNYFYQYSQVLSTFKLPINSKLNTLNNSFLDISKFINEAGIYRVRLYSTDKKSSKLYDEKVLFISDIAISAKISNNQLFIMTNSLKNALPLSDVNIKLYAKNNSLIFEGKTAKDGTFVREEKNLIDKEPIAIVAESENDKNFLLINPRKIKEIKNSYKAFIFLERKIYRPNDELNFAVTVKNEKFTSLSDKPIKIVIKDSTQKEILNESIKTNELGIVIKKLKIQNFFKTGRYVIYIYFANKQIGYSEFFVEDFIPEQIKTTIELNKNEYFLNEYIKVKVNTNYLFGAKAKNLEAEAKLTAQKVKFNYKGYSFDSDEDTKEFKFKEVTKKFKLNEEANANLIFASNIIGKPTSILSGLLGVTIFDGGRGVSTYKSFSIYPFKEMVGLKRISNKRAIVDKEEKFKTILLNPITKEKIKREIEVEIKRVIWNYNYMNGGYNWSKSFEFVDKFKINSGDEFKFSAKSAGEYMVTLKDSISTHETTLTYSVDGFDYSPIKPRDSIKELVLTIDDREYNREDDLNITINSPITGKLLLTFERENVFKYKFYDLTKNSISINEKLDFIFNKGFYLNAYVIRGTGIDEKTLPFRAYGSKYIKANMDRYRSQVKLKHSKMTKSKSKFNMEIDSSNLGYAIISVVDEGILQILNEKVPNPFEFFYTKALNSMNLFDFYDDVLSSFIKSNIVALGGDLMSQARMKKHLPPKNINKRVKPFSIFKVVKLKDKKTNIDIDIPNFNGKAKVIVYVVSKDRVGITSNSFIVKDRVVIKPTYPKFLIEGDNLKVPLKVFNDLNESLDLTIETNGVEVSSNKSQIKAKSEEDITLNIKALNENEGYIKLKVGEYFHEVHLPIHSSKTLITKSFMGESEKKVIINKIFENPQAMISISNSYLKSLKGEFNNLINYPYGCLEQTSSKLLSLLNLEKFIDANVTEKELLFKEREVFIKNGILKLQDMQLNDGSFAYWENSKSFNQFASIYAIDTLLTLKNSGFEVPQKLLDKAIAYLQNSFQKMTDKTNLFYTLWLLSREGVLIDSAINVIYDSKVYSGNLLSSAFMISILEKNGFINEAKILLSNLNNFNLDFMSNAREYGGSFYSKLRDIAFSYYLLSTHKDETISKRLFKYIKQNIKSLSSTQERAFVFRALSEHYKNLTDEVISVMVDFNNQSIFVDNLTILEANLTTNVTITPKKKTFVNYAIDIFSYIDAPLNSEIKSSFYTKRSFIDEKAKKVNLNSLHLGDLIYLKLDLSSSEKIENLAVVNKIPSCLEIINTRINSFVPKFKDNNYRPDYVDIRDDRVISFLTIDKNTTFYLPLRVSFRGECKMRETNIEAMYDSSVNGYIKEIEVLGVE